MPRAFLAFVLQPATLNALRPVQESADTPNVRVVPQRNLHLTLKFFDDLPSSKIESLQTAIRALHPTRYAAVLEGTGAFPNARQPRAIYAAVRDGFSETQSLMSRIDDVCAQLDLPVETKPRTPHVTLMRIRKPSTAATAFVEAHRDTRWGPIDTGRILLFESQLSPGGSIYTPLWEVTIA